MFLSWKIVSLVSKMIKKNPIHLWNHKFRKMLMIKWIIKTNKDLLHYNQTNRNPKTPPHHSILTPSAPYAMK